MMMGEDSLLERVTAAAEERQLSHNSLLAYRRTWLRIIAWAAAEGLVLETLPPERVGEFYLEATRGRSASHQFAGPDGRLRFATTQAFLQRFGLASLHELTTTSLSRNQPAIEPLI